MKKTYESPLDFVQEYSELQDWSTMLDKETEKPFSDIDMAGVDFVKNSRTSSSKKGGNLSYWKISHNDFGSFIWYAILESPTVKTIFERLHLSLKAEDYMLQIIPLNSHDKISYSALIFHKNYTNSIPQTITLNKVTKHRILEDLYMNSTNRYSETIVQNTMKWRSEHLFNEKGKNLFNYMDIDTFEAILFNLKFEIVIYKYPELTYLSKHPTQILGVAKNTQPELLTSSVGVIARNANGDLGVTTCYHEFKNDHQFGGIGSLIYINDHKATVSSIHELSDSCFMTFTDQSIKIDSADNKGPLISVSPQQNLSYNFSGINGKKKTIVTSWDHTIPFVRPNINIVNMQKVYTTADTQRGDSGSALIDNNDFVVGFSGFRTGVGFPVPFSVWIWAEEVYYAHKIN